MQTTNPDPTPIPPEMPTDPARVPPPDLPINTPPEKGPGRPEPMPPGPTRPTPVTRSSLPVLAVAMFAFAAGPAFAQRPAGKDTSHLEPPNPQQSECSQIGDDNERAHCIERYQPSGEPGTGKPTGDRLRPVNPSVGHETVPAPAPTDPGAHRTQSDPNNPQLSR